jgi:hypothetical protein
MSDQLAHTKLMETKGSGAQARGRSMISVNMDHFRAELEKTLFKYTDAASGWYQDGKKEGILSGCIEGQQCSIK